MQVFLMRETRVAEVDLIVDDSRKKMQSRRINRLVGGRPGGRIDCGDLCSVDQHIDRINAGRENTVCVTDECLHADGSSIDLSNRKASGRRQPSGPRHLEPFAGRLTPTARLFVSAAACCSPERTECPADRPPRQTCRVI